MELTKMDGMSKDMVAERLAQLKALIPEAFTEGKIDFDALKGALGEAVDSTKNHYSFTWNKKEEYRAFALRPSMGTLRPCVAESSGKDGTPGKFDSENLYIEGDNLEVLKLLQGSYYGKVKMIYIDPPYNTGKDFVYEDDFHDSVGNYKAVTGQTDSEGKSTRTNPETSGRYHTDWLNMMFPRLLLARKLLMSDGVIFISIDDNEIVNLRKLCDEVFGEDNFVAQFVWRGGRRNAAKFISTSHEYMLCYARDLSYCAEHKVTWYEPKRGLPAIYEAESNIRHACGDDFEEATKRMKAWYASLQDGDPSKDHDHYCNFDKKGLYFASDISRGGGGGPTWDLINPMTGNKVQTPARGWAYTTYEELLKDVQEDLIHFNGDGVPCKKMYLKENETQLKETVFYRDRRGSVKRLRKLLGGDIFPFPKDEEVLKDYITAFARDRGSIILDFFSGSASTAHATFLRNVEDEGYRRFIMVQLPELTYEIKDGQKKALKESKAAFEAGYENICEIGKERIRRAGKKIAEENATVAPNLDIGFKVFKLDTSNLIPWNPNPEDLEKSLLAAVDNAVEGRTVDDILYEVLLKCNLPLTLPIVKEPFGENTINVIGEGALMICLDKKIPATVAEEMIRLRDEKYKPVVPMQVVFLDNGFTDKDKANAIVTLKQAGVEEKAIMSI